MSGYSFSWTVKELWMDRNAVHRNRWYYQECCLLVNKGEHILTARVICLGFQKWAYAQLSVRHGFWLEDEKGILSDWEYQIEQGCSFESGFPDWGAFPVFM